MFWGVCFLVFVMVVMWGRGVVVVGGFLFSGFGVSGGGVAGVWGCLSLGGGVSGGGCTLSLSRRESARDDAVLAR